MNHVHVPCAWAYVQQQHHQQGQRMGVGISRPQSLYRARRLTFDGWWDLGVLVIYL